MKKILNALLLIALTLFFTTPVYAAETNAAEPDPYQAVLEQINSEYGTDLEYIPVTSDKATIEEYEAFVRMVASNSARTEDEIENRTVFLPDSNENALATMSGSKSVTHDTWGSWATSFSITASYNIDGNKISAFNDAYVNNKVPVLYFFQKDAGYPTHSIIDSGRTLAVTFYGTVYESNLQFSIGNVKLYAEFNANS